MRYPKAIWTPGPPSKQGYVGMAVNACRGVVCHSMVGPFSAALGELMKLERRASWHFSVLKNGDVHQHYELEAVTWHCGSKKMNGVRIGIEHEGGLKPFNEPLTLIQRDSSVELVHWIADVKGWRPTRDQPGRTLDEHNEIAPPEDATACPSDRIPWQAYEVEEEDDMRSFLCWDLTNKRVMFVGPDGPKWIVKATVVAELEKQFGPMTVALSADALKALGAA